MKRIYFGTDGVRGPYGGPVINEAFAERLGAAAGRFASRISHGGDGVHRVLIGRDTRASGESLLEAVAAGLASVGVDAVSLGVLPTPAVAAAVVRERAVLGVMITASHNPAADNGIKFFAASGMKLTGLIAWLGWIALHIMFLLGSRNRIQTLVNLAVRYSGLGRSGVIVGDVADKDAISHRGSQCERLLHRLGVGRLHAPLPPCLRVGRFGPHADRHHGRCLDQHRLLHRSGITRARPVRSRHPTRYGQPVRGDPGHEHGRGPAHLAQPPEVFRRHRRPGDRAAFAQRELPYRQVYRTAVAHQGRRGGYGSDHMTGAPCARRAGHMGLDRLEGLLRADRRYVGRAVRKPDRLRRRLLSR